MNIDIRNQAGEITSITFADEKGGGGRLYLIEKNVPVQINLLTVGGDRVHVKSKDIDSLIKALQAVKSLWRDELEG